MLLMRDTIVGVLILILIKKKKTKRQKNYLVPLGLTNLTKSDSLAVTDITNFLPKVNYYHNNLILSS
jgi:hypothetical protein